MAKEILDWSEYVSDEIILGNGSKRTYLTHIPTKLTVYTEGFGGQEYLRYVLDKELKNKKPDQDDGISHASLILKLKNDNRIQYEKLKKLQIELNELRTKIYKYERVRDLAEDYVVVGVPCKDQLKKALKDLHDLDSANGIKIT